MFGAVDTFAGRRELEVACRRYLVPYIAEHTQYALTRGKQRAEHDFAREHIGESPIGELSRAYQMVSQVVGPSVVVLK